MITTQTAVNLQQLDAAIGRTLAKCHAAEAANNSEAYDAAHAEYLIAVREWAAAKAQTETKRQAARRARFNRGWSD